MRKPRNRSKNKFTRSAPKFSGDKILIVCEGEKTETQYFKDLREKRKIHQLQIEIHGKECDSAPIKVVEHAEKMLNENKALFDHIWCVFDRDTHETFDKAIDKANSINNNIKGKKPTFNIAFSTPSFEFWFLLHFAYTTKQFKDNDEVRHDLQAYIPDYKKNQSIINSLYPNLEKAFKGAERINNFHHKSAANPSNRTWHPYTNVDHLVKKILTMKPA
jgi:RloB-like protein